jgi:hypothetical protein
MTTTPLPAGAAAIGDWRLDRGQARRFDGTKRATAMQADGSRVHVDITGAQTRDGTVERYIVINGDIYFGDVRSARAFAADVLAAVEEWETLTG